MGQMTVYVTIVQDTVDCGGKGDHDTEHSNQGLRVGPWAHKWWK